MSDYLKPEDFDRVRSEELEAIKERRQAVGQSIHLSESGLVGVALSGGGIRSALYNLGFLQALAKFGLLKRVDYLSAVSGGGYIAAHLSALAHGIRPPMATPRPTGSGYEMATGCPRNFYEVTEKQAWNADSETPVSRLGVEDDGKLSSAYRFRHIGDYLFRDITGFAWRYLLYTGLTVLTVFSGIAVIVAMAAILWRAFDNENVRDRLAFVGLQDLGRVIGMGDDTIVAFFPSMVLLLVLALVAFARMVQYRFSEANCVRRALSKLCKWTLGVFLASLAVSFAVAIGNGEVMGTSGSYFSFQQHSFWPVIGVTLLTLLPFLRTRSVVDSVKDTSSPARSLLGSALIGAACFFVPFCVLYWVARENVSGFATYRDSKFEREDILDWTAFSAILKAAERKAETGATGVGQPLQDACEALRATAAKIHADERKLREDNERFLQEPTWDSKNRLLLTTFLQRARFYLTSFAQYQKTLLNLRKSKETYVREFNSFFPTRLNDPSPGDENDFSVLLAPFLHQEYEARNNPAQSVSGGAVARTDQRVALSDETRSNIDRWKLLTKNAPASKYPAQTAFLGLDPRERSQTTRELLELLYPRVVRYSRMISTQIVPENDQLYRLRFLAAAAITWALLLVVVNWNGCAPFFEYYRNKLELGFVRSALGTDENLRLKDVRPWTVGAPFPISLASVQFFRRVSRSTVAGMQDDCAGARDIDAMNSDTCHPFVMTPLRVGTPLTGWEETSSYLRGDLRLCEAAALSGAAVTPFATSHRALRFIMSVLNLQLGQWLPVPTTAQVGVKRLYANGLFLLRQLLTAMSSPLQSRRWLERRPFGLVADGGFHEFFGLEELLLRRCRLIFVSDAACNNGKFEFGALADTLRLLRTSHGFMVRDLSRQPINFSRDLEFLRRNEHDRFQKHHFTSFRVEYPPSERPDDATECLIVYSQMSMTGDEELDLQQFRNVTPDFPYEPTTNQNYSSDQVESFRQLGYHVGRDVCKRELTLKEVAELATMELEELCALLARRTCSMSKIPFENQDDLTKSTELYEAITLGNASHDASQGPPSLVAQTSDRDDAPIEVAVPVSLATEQQSESEVDIPDSATPGFLRKPR